MRRAVLMLSAGVVLAAAAPAFALINPRFTPINLTEQATLIAVVKPSAPDAKGKVAAEVVECLKGELAARKITVDLMDEWVKPIAADIAQSDRWPALLFAGQGEDKQDAVFLHLAGRWLRLDPKGDAAYAMTAVDIEMRGTWSGGSDMLLAVVKYILADPSADVPVAVGCTWADRKVLGTIDGPVHGAQAIDLTGQGPIALFVAAANGDRIYRYDASGRKFVDATAALRLASKSRIAAWADFTGDGRADLASWDGKILSLWSQSADGAFPAQSTPFAADLKGACLGLSVLDAGVEGRAGLLAGTADGLVLLVPQKDGAFKPAALDAGAADRKKLGPPGACLVADFDGDGTADVLEPFAESSLFYKGRPAGTYAAAAKCNAAQGPGKSVAWTGDFDGNGWIDIFMSGQDACRVWHNRGGEKASATASDRGEGPRFEETFALSGETAYMLQPKAVCGQTCDINNDGWQDVLVGYREGIPMIFFNRGFRSFGKAMEITEDNVIPEANKGVQAAAVEDFNGDGAQDLAVVLKGGEVRMFVRSADEPDKCVGVRVALPMGKGSVGPVTVTGWADKRCLGAWPVTAGSPGALIARVGAGKLMLKWQLPGGRERQKELTVGDKPVSVLLDDAK